LIPSHRTK